MTCAFMVPEPNVRNSANVAAYCLKVIVLMFIIMFCWLIVNPILS